MAEKRQLILDKYGLFLSKHSERLRVKSEGQIVEEVPLIHLDSVLITSRGVSVSSDVVEICAVRGIDIVYISGNGEVYGRLSGPSLVGTVKTRREQLMALGDERGYELGKAFAAGKIQNQKNIIRYFARYRKVVDKELFEFLEDSRKKLEGHIKSLMDIAGRNVDEIRDLILNIEGRSAAIYWEAMRALLRENMEWQGREGRGAKDPINSALNYGYAILYGQVEKAIILAGLDPYAGFVHTDRAGKPSLVLDMIEEFRQQVVDRVIFGMLGKGSEVKVDDEGMLDEKTRKTIAQKLFERLDGEERYGGMKQKLRTILLKQAQAVASFVRRDRPIYKPFVGGW
ncbi:MAG TPA: CRISPR-associated endonuclease Cas1 [Candidatus Hydrothermia bacterium]|nr:CRISPR-associated endonuclease Cas1 [Candidatus Hydrothermia bacterium]HPO79575.1 CRISPR-associated endonuclease Cas1 [Candidatus Hydrothermia bacterium]